MLRLSFSPLVRMTRKGRPLGIVIAASSKRTIIIGMPAFGAKPARIQRKRGYMLTKSAISN